MPVILMQKPFGGFALFLTLLAHGVSSGDTIDKLPPGVAPALSRAEIETGLKSEGDLR